MADDLDITAERQEKEWALRDKQRAIEAARPKSVSEDCIDCGNHIPIDRQAATGGTTKCAYCQSIDEQKRRHFR